MSDFDTRVQEIKYKVICEVARQSWNGTLLDNILDIPQKIIPGKEPTMRCCVYKERAIISERVKIAMGGDKSNANVIEVIDIACDDCPMGGYEVTSLCRGCLAHRCESACKRGAISFDKFHMAHIDKSKCVECGACSKACQFNAIVNYKKPCQSVCKVNAITFGEDKRIKIDDSKCISCGTCAHMCPFGAIMSKSYILNVINYLKHNNESKSYNVYAILAPTVASQYSGKVNVGQVVTGLKNIGFTKVLETAIGADMVALKESKELAEHGFATSSCCPAFAEYINKHFPSLKEYVSGCASPMAELGKFIKSNDPTAKVVFVGPCIAKKAEAKRMEVAPFVDAVLTFQEMQALLESRDIELEKLDSTPLDNASYFGRIFARSGGLSEAVKQALDEQNIDFEVKPCICSGIDQCRIALVKKSHNLLAENFIEGMACVGGCVGGPGNIIHKEGDCNIVNQFAYEVPTAIKQSVDKIKGEL